MLGPCIASLGNIFQYSLLHNAITYVSQCHTMLDYAQSEHYIYSVTLGGNTTSIVSHYFRREHYIYSVTLGGNTTSIVSH